MIRDVNINALDFGPVASAPEEDAGDFLENVFLEPSIYSRTKSLKNELIIGRKGAGKSALFVMLKKAFQSEGLGTIEALPSSFSPYKLDQINKNILNKDQTYYFMWKYVLLSKIGKIIYDNIQLKKTKTANQKKEQRRIRRFLVESGEVNKNFFEVLLSFRRKGTFTRFLLTAFNTGFEYEFNPQQVDERDIVRDLQECQSVINALLARLNEKKVFVLIDKIDDLWNEKDLTKAMIIGLIKANHDLNSALRSAHIILFLRADIYDTLRFNDLDHLHSSEGRLDWKEEELKELIARRGKFSTGFSSISTDDFWASVFRKRVSNELPLQYIVKRTLKRPREVILFCQLALKEAQKNGHDYIQAKDILEAEKDYSNRKLVDLQVEFLVPYPFLEDLLRSLTGFQKEFKRSDFDSVYQQAKRNLLLSAKYTADELRELRENSTDQMLEILFRVGALGERINQQDLFVIDTPSPINMRENTLLIHPMLHAALNVI